MIGEPRKDGGLRVLCIRKDDKIDSHLIFHAAGTTSAFFPGSEESLLVGNSWQICFYYYRGSSGRSRAGEK